MIIRYDATFEERIRLYVEEFEKGCTITCLSGKAEECPECVWAFVDAVKEAAHCGEVLRFVPLTCGFPGLKQFKVALRFNVNELGRLRPYVSLFLGRMHVQSGWLWSDLRDGVKR